MSRIGSRRTGPERQVARALRERSISGWRRYRKIGGAEIDFAWPKERIALYVNGCFWHGHGCGRGKIPKTRHSYWRAKLEGNVERDARQLEALEQGGWTVFVVWECDLKSDVFPETIGRLEECLNWKR
jgi:DNA mismatch endonuclease (patch repair protein)